MPYWLELDPCKFPTGDLLMQFVINSGNYFGARPQKLLKFGDIIIGSDRDNEVIYYPNNFEIDLKSDDDFEDWLTYLKDLSIEDSYALISDESDVIFRGPIQKSSVKGDMFRKSLSFRAYDCISNLKNFDPKDNELSYGTTEKRTLIDILTDIFTLAAYYPDNTHFIEEVVSLCSYEAKIDGSASYATFDAFGVVPYEHYFSSTPGEYDTVLDVVKSILHTYGCIGYVGTDRKFYLIPRTYQFNPVFDIDNNMIANIETSVMRKMMGLKLYVYDAGSGGGWYQTYTYGDVTTDPERVEEIRIDQAVGLLPDNVNSASNLFLWNGSTWDTADFDGVRRKQSDGTYTSDKSLWRLTGDDTWAAIQKDRLNYRVTLKGIYNNLTKKSDLLSTHNPKQFYRLTQFPNEYLRPRKFKYDLNSNEVEIDLLST